MFKNLFENKNPAWDIISKSWKNASDGYIKAQEDIIDDLVGIQNKIDAEVVAELYPNRDFDIMKGSKIILRMPE